MSSEREYQECQSCGRTFGVSMRHCPFCGAEHRRAASSSPPACPRCGCALASEAYRGSEVDTCPRCSGVWLDTDEFEFHTSARDVLTDESIPRTHERPQLHAESGYLPCPRCGTLMVRRNFRHISGVLLDFCRDHGVWLDAGELEQVRSFIASGGLDKAQDREIAANSAEIARVAAETKELRRFVGHLHRWDIRRILGDLF